MEPREYRFRLLNGSDSRFYDLFLPGGQRFHQVGTDNGLLDAPVPLNHLVLAPGERADVVIDFSKLAGRTVVLRNIARSPFPLGEVVDPRTTGQIMAFRVSKPLSSVPLTSVAAAPLAGPIAPLSQTGATRGLLLFEGVDAHGRLQPMLGVVGPTVNKDGLTVDGTLAWDDAMTELPRVGDVEVWEIYNNTEDAHPIHLHEVAFQVVSRQKFQADVTPKPMGDGATGGVLGDVRLLGQPKPPGANEAGWKDTVVMYPGEVTRIIVRFDRAGEYVWHCHILSHEDHEMMRPYEILPKALAAAAAPRAGEDGAVVLLGAAVRVYWPPAEATAVRPAPVTVPARKPDNPPRPSPLAVTDKLEVHRTEPKDDRKSWPARFEPPGPEAVWVDGPDRAPGGPHIG